MRTAALRDTRSYSAGSVFKPRRFLSTQSPYPIALIAPR